MNEFRTTGIPAIDMFLAGGVTATVRSGFGDGHLYCGPRSVNDVQVAVYLAVGPVRVAVERYHEGIEVFRLPTWQSSKAIARARAARLVVEAFGLLYEPEAIAIPPLLVQAWRAWRRSL